eukprot:CAMPEP_0201619590 /NCGR_PEP_ID=MMETSP0492-20130828/41956_1 /ASSEMBLY_ACC=CAM_ASM_000837 /TAXON_ID=420259 /ORGANISM="Thalassiosira gravida, Strain GMp14c1" /LENGTH=63 /DNA_ID=CAMNT_0048088513 /DNA_START=142 /DNA_END=334 /DNA_ORIENTATION=-
MAADTFEKEIFGTRSSDSMVFDSGGDELQAAAPRSGESMAADVLEDGLFDPQFGVTELYSARD